MHNVSTTRLITTQTKREITQSINWNYHMALDRLFGNKAFQDFDALWTGHTVLVVCTEVEILGHALVALRFNHTVLPL
jgi:predicted acylesterase/phospholipase RssA